MTARVDIKNMLQSNCLPFFSVKMNEHQKQIYRRDSQRMALGKFKIKKAQSTMILKIRK